MINGLLGKLRNHGENPPLSLNWSAVGVLNYGHKNKDKIIYSGRDDRNDIVNCNEDNQ